MCVYIYGKPEVCVGHAAERWGRGDPCKKSAETARERGMWAAGLCLSLQHRESTVLNYIHTHRDERAIYLDLQRGCSGR